MILVVYINIIIGIIIIINLSMNDEEFAALKKRTLTHMSQKKKFFRNQIRDRTPQA